MHAFLDDAIEDGTWRQLRDTGVLITYPAIEGIVLELLRGVHGSENVHVAQRIRLRTLLPPEVPAN